jgi:hypothetical protein
LPITGSPDHPILDASLVADQESHSLFKLAQLVSYGLACNFFWSLLIALKLTLPACSKKPQGFPITRDHPITGSPDY